MAAGNNCKAHAKPCRFFVVLLSAICEWSLVLFLLINALLAYLATRFARLCKLPAPCILCSRLDHIFGSEKQGFYKNLFCQAHKMEISSLVFCHGHKKLAYFRDMCEACLVSTPAVRKTHSETSGLFGRNLLANRDDDTNSCDKFDREDGANVPLLSKDLETASSGTTLCSCCSEPFNLNRLLQAKKKSMPEGGVHNRGAQLRNRQDKPLGSTTIDISETRDYDLQSLDAYTEQKLASDSESEVSFSDEDEYVPLHVAKKIREESVRRRRLPLATRNNTKEGSAIIIMEDIVPEKLIHQTPVPPEHSVVATATKTVNEADSCDKSSRKSAAAVGHVEMKANPQAVRAQTCHAASAPAAAGVEIGKVSSTSITTQAANDSIPAARSLVDHNDGFRNALSNRGIMSSPRFCEIVAGKESSRAQEELKLRLSRALDASWSDVASPRDSDASSTLALQNIAKRLSVDRTSSSLEAFDATIICDVEGETSVDRLKQQIEIDRKSMGALYKELDEERSASAIAANEAMAMINRLQEEKAAMQMEALQYLRMMEEQAEYDQEANQKLNELLCHREKELVDLTRELEDSKRRLREAALADMIRESILISQSRETPATTPRVIRTDSIDFSPATTPRHLIPELGELSPANTPRRMKLLCRSKSEKMNMMAPESTDYGVKDLVLSFEEEKANISACLRKLQKKLSTKQEHSLLEENASGNGRRRELNNVNLENSFPPSAQYSNIRENTNLDDQLNSVEETPRKSNFDSYKDRIYAQENESVNMNHLKDEVLKLMDKVETLDADKEFLGHAINALKYGTDGIQLVQEIASELKELRRIPVTAKQEILA
ncbi:myosin-binding protein 1-like [Canna indica]|uniref:Myosin-binding protein 1-like n=1 Tax=Canna indica TaxID=4628 RepID=A0AAQ3Q5N4_9LILI|nr:myosin-binding protein 1-like [Canna indica]